MKSWLLNYRMFQVLLTVATLLSGLSQASAAVTLVNAGVYINAKTIAAGNALTVSSSVKASSEAVSNAKLTYSFYALSAANVSASSPSLTYVYSAQNFAAGQSKSYQVPFTFPKTLVNGKYLLKIFATNADASIKYFSMENVSDIATVTLTGGASATPTPTPTPAVSYLRGVNVMDLGNRGSIIPGIYGYHYTRPNLTGLQALKARGITTIRLSFVWERLQSTLGGPLDTAYLGYILDSLKDANTAGLKVILDLHNYARYLTPDGQWRRFGDVGGPTQANFNQIWKDFVKAVQANPTAYAAVTGFDLMNEPFDLPSINGQTPQRLWEVYAQGAVDSIRSTGEKKTIFVGGYFFSSAESFGTYHPTPFITDSANNIMYEAHFYADYDTSGTYTRTFAQETALAVSSGKGSVSARALARVKSFSDWATKNKVRGFIGEFGWPNSEYVGDADAASWNQVAEDIYKYMDSVNMGATTWVVCTEFHPGNSNILNSYYLPGANGNAVMVPLSNAAVLEKHPSK